VKPGQRPRQHTRRVNGRTIVVNAGVPGPTATSRRARGGPAGTVAGFVDEPEVRVHPVGVSPFTSWGKDAPPNTGEVWTVTETVHADGTGSIEVSDDAAAGQSPTTFKVGPGVTIRSALPLSHVDYRGFNLPEVTFVMKDPNRITGCRFDGVNLAGAEFRGGPRRMSAAVRTSFRGAVLRDATFHMMTFSDVDLRESDLTGVTFSRCYFGPLSRMVEGDAATTPGEYAIDVRGSNFHPSMLGREDHVVSPTSDYTLHLVRYDKYTLDEAAELLGMPAGDVAVHVWAGDIEVRDNETLERVTGGFDVEHHHIPQWALPRWDASGTA